MKATESIALLVLTLAVVSPPTADGTNPGAESAGHPGPTTVGSAYRNLASSVLTHAVLAELPEGVLLRSAEVEITQDEVEQEAAKAPEALREQLRKNAFFLLEQMAIPKLLLVEARDALQASGKDPASMADQDILREYFESVTSDVNVTDEDAVRFYQENKAMFGGANIDQVKDQIRQYLLGLKKQEAGSQHIATLGTRMKIEVAAGWTEQQAALAADNPVDKARNSGKPSVVDFGADGCRPCDMMVPVLAALRKEYDGKINVEFVHVREEQILAARYGVGTIPVQVFYDAEGKEVFRHVGFFPQDEIEKRLAEMGIE